MEVSEELEIQLKREVFEASYYEFFKWSFRILFPNEMFEDAFHIKFLCDIYQGEVERIIRKEEKDQDIIVNIPPRTSKTLITSVSLNAWAWIKDPTLPFINISFDEQLVLLNSRYCKDLINSPEFQELFGERFQIRRDVNGAEFFMNNKGGFRMSKTTGSNITGHKGVIIIVDDPQNPKTAESEVQRQTTIDYYTRSLYNRLTPVNLGVRIIIMQRLHQNDLTGYLLEHNAKDYRHICLPAEASNLVNPPELKQHYKEGLLDPVRLSKKILESFKGTLGSRGYAGQYEQTPSEDAGGIIKPEWFDIISPLTLQRDIINEPVHFIIDSAYTMKTENDPTAILTCFKRQNRLYILDVREVWLEFPQLIQFIISHTAAYQYSSYSKIFVEPKASGKSIVQQLRAITQLNVIESASPDTDKITRANGVSPQLEARRAALIDGSYIPHYLDQLKMFPNTTHDDMVDVTVIAVQELLFENGPDFLFI